ncbi:hypothetical protein BSKO_00467 [Bryopsis sp. KO-2023]|nr:hypothetical protein BSKO_00467 [Bryopsis sp. KO-2023]
MPEQDRETVLVTGCSSGLGRALCEALHGVKSNYGARAYRVFSTARDVDRIQDLAAKGMEALPLDVCSADSVSACVAELKRKADKTDILIANAGVLRVMPLIEQPLEDIRDVLETNVVGVMRIVQAVVPDMIKRRKGTVVIIGSVSGYLTTPFGGIYSGSKACVHALADSLRMELHPFNVNVLYVEAGAFKSSLAANGASSLNLPSDSLYKSVKSSIDRRLQIGQMSSDHTAEMTAKQIVAAMREDPPPFKVKAGGKAGYYKFVGLLATYIAPGLIFNKLCRMFGLADMKKALE